MTAKRTDMHHIQELIRLHRLGTKIRAIARSLGMGRDTVRTYTVALRDAGLLDGAADTLPEGNVLQEALNRLLPAKPAPQQVSSIAKWEPRITTLWKGGARPRAIFDRLRVEDITFPGSLSAVKRICVRLLKQQGPRADQVAIRVDTSPGEVAQVDFGYFGELYDPERGVMRRAWVFVMVLCYSRHLFAAIAFDQKVETWVDVHIRAFEFFGGVPAVIVPDNLKAAVIRAAFGVDDEAVLNRSYRELARFHGFRIDPTPPRAPRKKGKVESAVKYVNGNFSSTCESQDAQVVQRELVRWVVDIAGRRIHGTTGCRPLEVFEAEERCALKALPQRTYDRVIWKRAKLHSDAHVQIDNGFYSAPWRLLHQDLWARCTKTEVSLYHHDELIHVHRRVARGQRSTVETHLPEHRAALRHRSRSYWEERAAAIGEETLAFVRDIFDSDDVLVKLRMVQAIVVHLLPFPQERAEAACRRARHFGSYSYAAVKKILCDGLDREPLPDSTPPTWLTQGRYARSGAEIAKPHRQGEIA